METQPEWGMIVPRETGARKEQTTPPYPLGRLPGERTLAEFTGQFDVHPNQITQWKTQLLDRAAQVFVAGAGPAEKSVGMKALHARIGEFAWRMIF